MQSQSNQCPRRARRTKQAVESAIAEAVLAELEEVGFPALTFEAVARRAQVSKPVLYRRHASRTSLVLAALAQTAQKVYGDPPMTGSLRSDLVSWWAKAQAHAAPLRPATLRGLVGEASETEMLQVAELLRARMQDMERCVLEPARQRGELVGTVPASVVRLFFTLLRDQALFGTLANSTNFWMIDEIIMPLLQLHGLHSNGRLDLSP